MKKRIISAVFAVVTTVAMAGLACTPAWANEVFDNPDPNAAAGQTVGGSVGDGGEAGGGGGLLNGDYNFRQGLSEIEGSGAGLATGGISTGGLVKSAIGWVMFAVGVLSVGLMIWGGFKYMTSSGDSGKVKAAKNIILYGLIGLAIVILSYVIVNFVLTTVGAGAVA